MKVMGPALITAEQQRALADGAMLTIATAAVYPDAAKRARAGGWWWVQEPHVEYVHKKSGHLIGLAPGVKPFDIKTPPDVRYRLPVRSSSKQLMWDYTVHQLRPTRLRREESWNTLEIVDVLPGAAGWNCRVHLKNIDALLAERRAA